MLVSLQNLTHAEYVLPSGVLQTAKMVKESWTAEAVKLVTAVSYPIHLVPLNIIKGKLSTTSPSECMAR